jgi:hypothetical protein
MIRVRWERRQEKNLVVGDLTRSFQIAIMLRCHLRVILRAPKSAIRWLALFLLILFPAWNLLLLLKSKNIGASTCRAHDSNSELLLHIWLSLMVIIHQYVVRLLAIYDILCLQRMPSWVRIQILRKSCHRHSTLLPHMQLDIGLLWW